MLENDLIYKILFQSAEMHTTPLEDGIIISASEESCLIKVNIYFLIFPLKKLKNILGLNP